MRRHALLALACAGAFSAAPALAQEDYGFDAAQFEKKPFELGGYAELALERFALNRDAALYGLNFFDQGSREDFDRGTGAVQLEGLYRRGIASLRFLGHASRAHDYTGSDDDTRLYEGYLSLQPNDRTTLDLGKKVMRWGKGYAWNPAGFVERPKDPNDPELSREGHTMLAGDFVRSLDGPLKTVAFTPLVVPTGGGLNDDFGAGAHANPAARLYLLYRDTDIDFMLLGAGSRSARYGFDFARNLTTNFEIHGEWARITEAERPVADAAGDITRVRERADSYLLGLRHLSERDTTTILEYYFNGAGYTEDEMRVFFTLAHDTYAQYQATGNAAQLARLRATVLPAYARPNPMRRYLYLRVSQKEPFDILYFTPAVTAIANADDRSYSVAPELLYTGVTNLELRLRVFFLSGDRLTDFGEKQNDRRVEFRVRYFF